MFHPQVKDVKEKALALSEYPESSFQSVLTKLFGKMPALLSDNVSSSSDSSYVSTVTELSAADPAPEPASPPATAPQTTTPPSKQIKKKTQRKRKKGSSSTSPSSMELPPPPPPVLECANNTSASYADMLRKPQPIVLLSECSSESDLTTATPHNLSESHSTSCPNIAWEKCPTSLQCKHQQLEFLNESSISNNDNQLANVITISQGDLQSVFDSSKTSGRYHTQTTLRPYSIYNHQSDTISDSHQRLINYFSRGRQCSKFHYSVISFFYSFIWHHFNKTFCFRVEESLQFK